MDENAIVKQANYLIENRPKMTKDETRLFITIVSMICENDEDFKPYKIPVSAFANLWHIPEDSAYQKVKAALRGLRAKEFYLEKVNPDTNKLRFFTASYISSASYEQGEGYAEVEVSPAFKPYLLALGQEYTKYKLQNMIKLTGVNAIRLYELLAQYKNSWNGERKIVVLDLKKMLGIESKYSLNADLIRYVIEPCIKEINELTDLLVTYNITGRGKKTVFLFKIKEKNNLSKNNEIESNLLNLAEKALETIETNRTANEYLTFLKTTVNLKTVDNKNAYFIKCILNKDNLDNFINQTTMEIEKDQKRLKGQAELDEILRKFEMRQI